MGDLSDLVTGMCDKLINTWTGVSLPGKGVTFTPGQSVHSGDVTKTIDFIPSI